MQPVTVTSISGSSKVKDARVTINDNEALLAQEVSKRAGAWPVVATASELVTLTTATFLDLAGTAAGGLYILGSTDPTILSNWVLINGYAAAASNAQAAAIAAAAIDATNKAATAQSAAQAYFDAQLGLRPIKDPARVAFQGNVSLSAPGTLVDIGVVPNVTIATTNRILLFGQTDGTQNGLYVYNGAGVPLTRTQDADISAEMKPGLLVAVTEGTYADKLFELQTDAPVTLGATVLTFGLASGGSSSSPLIAYNGSTYAPRNTVTSSSTIPVIWVGPVAPTVGSGYALAGDSWINTTEVS